MSFAESLYTTTLLNKFMLIVILESSLHVTSREFNISSCLAGRTLVIPRDEVVCVVHGGWVYGEPVQHPQCSPWAQNLVSVLPIPRLLQGLFVR
jgi:hypothetical protein